MGIGMKEYVGLPCADTKYHFRDRVGEMADRIIKNWLLLVTEANPGMIQMLKDRNQEPYRVLLPWSGEFVGKHLTALVEVYWLTGETQLQEEIEELIDELDKVQNEEGYIGPWADKYRLTGHAPNSVYEMGKEDEIIPNWDTWDFYHIMYGLLCWYCTKREKKALSICEKLADLLYREFFEKEVSLSSIGTPETNLAPIHSLALLYEVTENEKYLSMAEKIAEEFSLPCGGNYIRLIQAGKDYYEMPIPRWEGLHCIMGIGTLYDITGKEIYGDSFRRLWSSMCRTDRHNTGGFTSGEAACGNPYDGRAIETCCTVAWTALSVEMLKLEKNAYVADELELSFYNGGLGAISPSGRWCTYNTPMDGYKISSLKDIDFQVRPGTPELNCCSVNSSRVVGLLSQWACMRDKNAVYINYYGDYDTEIMINGKRVRIVQHSVYPLNGKICIALEAPDIEFTICLRIPHWTRNAVIKTKKGSIKAESGRYVALTQKWGNSESIELELEMNFHFWKGEREKQGKESVYYGPILLTYDEAFNETYRMDNDSGDDVFLERDSLVESQVYDGGESAWLFMDAHDAEGRQIVLCDFRSAGYQGRKYKTWFRMQ